MRTLRTLARAKRALQAPVLSSAAVAGGTLGTGERVYRSPAPSDRSGDGRSAPLPMARVPGATGRAPAGYLPAAVRPRVSVERVPMDHGRRAHDPAKLAAIVAKAERNLRLAAGLPEQPPAAPPTPLERFRLRYR